MKSSFAGFCYVCSEDTIFRREHEDEIFRCDRCGSAVEFTAVEETRLKDVAAV